MSYTAGMRAGTAEIPFELPLGIPMMGYGAREGTAEALADPLHARALYLENGGRVLLVQLEVCLVSVPQARALAERVAARTGLAPGEVWVAATHTHSGPETGIAAVLSGAAAPEFAAPLFDAAEEAAARAVDGAFAAKAGFGSARVSIGRNRREADGAVDPEVVVLRIDDEAGVTRAVGFVHGTHPTVLGHENLAWSADWPGAAAATVREAHPGAVPLFLLGAHADVDPRTRGLQDLAVPGQSLGAGMDAVRELGLEVGLAVREAVARAEPGELPVAARCTEVELPVHGAEDGEAGHAARVDARRRDAALAFGRDAAAPLRVSEVFALEQELDPSLPIEERRERLASARLFVRERTAPRLAGGLRARVEVRVLRLGDARWLGLPAEATAEVGLDWKEGRAPGSALLSNVGGWLRYLPHPRRFTAPNAAHHYEVLMSTFAPGAARELLVAGAGLAGALPGE